MSREKLRPIEAAASGHGEGGPNGPETSPIASTTRRKLDVLIVEDTLETAELLEDFVGAFGHQPRVAHDGARALELVAEKVPDLILLDLSLPDMTGHEIAAAIRARYGRACRIVALTGYSGREEREGAERSGCDAFLTKPVNIPELEALLEGAPPEGPR